MSRAETLSQGPILLGHSHPAMLQAVCETISSGQLYAAQHSAEVELAETLKRLIPCADSVCFSLPGSEAVDAALRVSRAYTRRPKFIQFEGHYHGWFDNVSFSVSPSLSEAGAPDNPSPVPWTQGISSGPDGQLIICPSAERITIPAEEHLGNIFLKQKDYEQAHAQFTHLLTLAPDDFVAHYNLAWLAAQEGKLEEGIRQLREALHAYPQNAEAHNALGFLDLCRGSLGEARSEFSAAIRENPKFAWAHCNLGLTLSRKKMYEEAAQEFRKALELDPRLQGARERSPKPGRPHCALIFTARESLTAISPKRPCAARFRMHWLRAFLVESPPFRSRFER